MQLNPIGIAVPFFFLLMAIEWWVSNRRQRDVYRLNDTMSDLTCGMGDQLINLLVGGLTLGMYAAVEGAWGWMEWTVHDAVAWVSGIVLVDLLYYAYHRFAHRVNFGWATHMVHHQSEEYNLAVALRQPWFAQFYAWLFYLPLALLGVPVEVYAASYAINLLYQYWIHTQLIHRLGPLEWVLNTPSHHRVHHGTNPQYIDKNYAGIFIVWDRMFGTFAEEDEEVVYGVMKPLQSWNPVWANVAPWLQLARASASQATFSNKVWMWFAEPGWTPSGVQRSVFPAPGRGYDKNGAPGLRHYMLAHLLPVILSTTLVISYSAIWPPLWLGLGAVYITWTGLGWSWLIESKPGAVTMEKARLVAVVVCALALASTYPTGLVWACAAAMSVVSVVSWPWLSGGQLLAETQP